MYINLTEEDLKNYFNSLNKDYVGKINFYSYNVDVYMLYPKNVYDDFLTLYINWNNVPLNIIKGNDNPFIWLSQIRKIMTIYLNKYNPLHWRFIQAKWLTETQKQKLINIYKTFLAVDRNLKYHYKIIKQENNNIVELEKIF